MLMREYRALKRETLYVVNADCSVTKYVGAKRGRAFHRSTYRDVIFHPDIPEINWGLRKLDGYRPWRNGPDIGLITSDKNKAKRAALRVLEPRMKHADDALKLLYSIKSSINRLA